MGAGFIWRYTALELNAQRQRTLITENDPTVLSGSEVIVSSRNEVLADTYSIGIKQNLSSSQAVIVPAITMGYAKQILEGKTRYVIDDSGTTSRFTLDEGEKVQDSCYAGASLRLRLAQLFGITTSLRSIMPKCDTNKFTDNTQFTAGLSWIF
jgi:hypothetical protein